MTEYTAHLIVGQPLRGMGDWSEDDVLKKLGVERIEGLRCLYQGDAFIGVEVRGLISQYDGPTLASSLDFGVPGEKADEARRLCDALPDRVKADPALMPFGVYIVGSDG